MPTVASITYLKRDLESIGPREVVHWLRVFASRGPWFASQIPDDVSELCNSSPGDLMHSSGFC